jgi:endonuclease/exonuclease/phosphatase family metal-dependent hydrolase
MQTKLIVLLLVTVMTSCGPVKTYVDPEGPSAVGTFAGTPPVAADTLKIVSFNIRYGEKVEEAIAELEEKTALSAPDIVLLQEMDTEGVEKISRRFGFNYVYFPAAIHRKHDREFGNAVASPWPLRDGRKIVLPFEQPFSKQKRNAVSAIVTIGDEEVLAYSVHAETYWLSTSKRIAQIDSLVRSIPPHFEIVVVGGDFNMSFTDHMKKAEQKLTDAGFERASKGIGSTMRIGPAGWFGYALDHIFTKGLTVVAAGKEEATSASDHLPIWVTATVKHPRQRNR